MIERGSPDEQAPASSIANATSMASTSVSGLLSVSPLVSIEVPPGGRSIQEVVRDPDYFLEGVVFQVENVLFSIPRHHFSESEGIFGTMFTLPQGVPPNADHKPEGSCAENPIKLHEKAEDFRALLKVLYPKTFPVIYDFTIPEWKAILHLSTKWGFDKVRAFAIERMSPILGNDPLARLMLGKDYGIRSWFKSSCVAFVNRYDGPTAEEAEKMGLEAAIKIYQTREQMLRFSIRSKSVFDAQAAVERNFRDELGPIDGLGSGSFPPQELSDADLGF